MDDVVSLREQAPLLDLQHDLRVLVDNLAINQQVLEKLLPDGKPHEHESQLWDYKEGLPQLPISPNEEDRKHYRGEIADLMKDAAAFHNAYGGYIVFGVKDTGADRIIGCDVEFDCGDFNQRLEGATGANIECVYARLPVPGANGVVVGLLLIPRRVSGAEPVTFKKAAPAKRDGSKAYNALDTYVRVRDRCRPANANSADWKFLFDDRSPRRGDGGSTKVAKQIRNNLPARDDNSPRFVGREEYLSRLRAWLADKRSPVRLLTGIGGLGKTSIAYRFAEEVIGTGAADLEWVIWLTAKERTYSAVRGEMVLANRVDFWDATSLFRTLLQRLGAEPLIDDEEDSSHHELIEQVVEALTIYSCLVVVDDIDSLEPEVQKEVVFALNSIAQRTVSLSETPSRILITSRIDEGVAPSAVIPVTGLLLEDFKQYVSSTAELLGVSILAVKNMARFHEATSGSPLFAASILRLVKLTYPFDEALSRWHGEDGEAVRAFAFQRELERLTASQARVLYSVLLLGETSVLELSDVLEMGTKTLGDRISELQSYHLIAQSTREGRTPTLSAPSDLFLMRDLLRSHLGASAADVEKACARARVQNEQNDKKLYASVAHVAALWRAGRSAEALVEAQELDKQFPRSGDVKCLLGNAYMNVVPPRPELADTAFSEAKKLRCVRPELMDGWIKAKQSMEDWLGLREITKDTIWNRAGHDRILEAHVLACEQLIQRAEERRDRKRVAELALEAVSAISRKFDRVRVSKGEFTYFSGKRFDLARKYVEAVSASSSRSKDYLAVFEAITTLADHQVFLSDQIELALRSVKAWWDTVQGLPFVESGALVVLKKSVRRLARLEQQVASLSSASQALAEDIAATRRDLEFKGAQLSQAS